jgi:ribosomal protein S18 acetylase RimI-like enzyme
MLKLVNSEDAGECAEVFYSAFTGPSMGNGWLTPEMAARYIGDIIASPGSLGFMYYRNDMLTGICVGGVSDYFIEPQYEIKEFAVIPSSQRRGAGSRMLREVERYLRKERGIKYIFLHTSRTIPAYAFYLKNDYTPVDDNVYFIKKI